MKFSLIASYTVKVMVCFVIASASWEVMDSVWCVVAWV